jgi:hypothetical protein
MSKHVLNTRLFAGTASHSGGGMQFVREAYKKVARKGTFLGVSSGAQAVKG